MNDGGPAFPALESHKHFLGMTLRDYFAGLALGNFEVYPERICKPHDEAECCDDIADFCYEMADAMMTARERKRCQQQR